MSADLSGRTRIIFSLNGLVCIRWRYIYWSWCRLYFCLAIVSLCVSGCNVIKYIFKIKKNTFCIESGLMFSVHQINVNMSSNTCVVLKCLFPKYKMTYSDRKIKGICFKNLYCHIVNSMFFFRLWSMPEKNRSHRSLWIPSRTQRQWYILIL